MPTTSQNSGATYTIPVMIKNSYPGFIDVEAPRSYRLPIRLPVELLDIGRQLIARTEISQITGRILRLQVRATNLRIVSGTRAILLPDQAALANHVRAIVSALERFAIFDQIDALESLQGMYPPSLLSPVARNNIFSFFKVRAEAFRSAGSLSESLEAFTRAQIYADSRSRGYELFLTAKSEVESSLANAKSQMKSISSEFDRGHQETVGALFETLWREFSREPKVVRFRTQYVQRLASLKTHVQNVAEQVHTLVAARQHTQAIELMTAELRENSSYTDAYRKLAILPDDLRRQAIQYKENLADEALRKGLFDEAYAHLTASLPFVLANPKEAARLRERGEAVNRKKESFTTAYRQVRKLWDASNLNESLEQLETLRIDYPESPVLTQALAELAADIAKVKTAIAPYLSRLRLYLDNREYEKALEYIDSEIRPNDAIHRQFINLGISRYGIIQEGFDFLKHIFEGDLEKADFAAAQKSLDRASALAKSDPAITPLIEAEAKRVAAKEAAFTEGLQRVETAVAGKGLDEADRELEALAKDYSKASLLVQRRREIEAARAKLSSEIEAIRNRTREIAGQGHYDEALSYLKGQIAKNPAYKKPLASIIQEMLDSQEKEKYLVSLRQTTQDHIKREAFDAIRQILSTERTKYPGFRNNIDLLGNSVQQAEARVQVDRLYKGAMDHYQRRLYEEALTRCREALRIDAQDERCLALLKECMYEQLNLEGESLLKQKRYTEALTAFKKAYDLLEIRAAKARILDCRRKIMAEALAQNDFRDYEEQLSPYMKLVAEESGYRRAAKNDLASRIGKLRRSKNTSAHAEAMDLAKRYFPDDTEDFLPQRKNVITFMAGASRYGHDPECDFAEEDLLTGRKSNINVPIAGLGYGRYLNEYVLFMFSADAGYKDLRYNSIIDDIGMNFPVAFGTIDLALYIKAWYAFFGGGISGTATILNRGSSYIDRRQIYGGGYHYGGGLLINRHDFNHPISLGLLISQHELSLFAKSANIGKLAYISGKLFLVVRF